MNQFLCHIDDLDDPGAAGFLIDRDGRGLAIFVVRRGGQVFGYTNSCPHTGAPLDWQEGKFLDFRQQFILCSLHGATFRIGDGYCVGGPCAGRSLTRIPLIVEAGRIFAENSPL